METIRLRLSALLEWLIAAAIIAGVVATTAVAVPQFHRRRAVPVLPVVDARPASTAVPPRAVSVPMLLFVDGRAVHLGDRLSDIARRVGAGAQVGEDAVDRVAGRERLTRFYEYVGTRFALVFESADGRSDPRVIGIYKE
ncbi:MAG TPA: hypothetical protein VG871_13765 [Vicinamibacterales bacterium]|nr:hypothetical protein [Vicinamibacterales bacterium]